VGVPHSTQSARRQSNEVARRQALARDLEVAASQRFDAALEACQGLPQRLTTIAAAADAKARALRNAHAVDLAPGPQRVNPLWHPPWELRRESPRLPVIAWQQLDRAFEQLTATLDELNADLRARASAYEQLATASRAVAEQLTPMTARASSAAHSHGAGSAGNARAPRRVIAGPTGAICDQCVGLCVALLDEELGGD
jgi:hypothetical protein